MIARYHARFVETRAGAVPVAEVQKYYDENRDQYSRPAYVHAELLFVSAAEGSPERAAKASEARRLLTELKADAAVHPDALGRLARGRSDDADTKPLGGDLGFRSRGELATLYGKEVAEAAFILAPGQLTPAAVEAPAGFYLLRVVERQEAQVRKLDDVRPQIVAVLADQQRDAEYEALVKKIQEEAQVRVSDAELEKVSVEAAPRAGP